MMQLVLRDLKKAWESVASIDFLVESMETDPQLLPRRNRGEAVVATGIEVRIGEAVGMMNLAFPALMINKFHQQDAGRSFRGGEAHMLGLVKPAPMELEVRLLGLALALDDLLAIEPGDVLTFDASVARPLDCLVNGSLKFRGQVVSARNKKAFLVESPATDAV